MARPKKSTSSDLSTSATNTEQTGYLVAVGMTSDDHALRNRVRNKLAKVRDMDIIREIAKMLQVI